MMSVVLHGDFDRADNAGVEHTEVFGGDPVFEDSLTADLVDVVVIQERPQHPEPGDEPSTRVLTFQSRAILAV